MQYKSQAGVHHFLHYYLSNQEIVEVIVVQVLDKDNIPLLLLS